MKNNKKLFCRLWNRLKDEDMIFLDSNSGTGKTIAFKWIFIRRALERDEYFDVFFRWDVDITIKFTNENFLKLPRGASNRLRKLAERVEIDGEYIVEKETKRKIARALAINIQSKYKSTENDILTCRAFFDEVLADDGVYCQNECYKHSRLIDTRARGFKYQVWNIYNNVSPFFPYRDWYAGSGAKFVSFVADKWGTDTEKGIQSVLKNSKYGEIYTNNQYLTYDEFYKDFDAKGFETLFYICIKDKIFAVKDCEDFVIAVAKKKIKKTKEVFSFNLANNEFQVATADNGIRSLLQDLINKRLFFTNIKQNTIYMKEIANSLSLCYNI